MLSFTRLLILVAATAFDKALTVAQADVGSCTVTTVAGSGAAGSIDGVGVAALLNGPSGMALLPSGAVALADQLGNTIRLMTPPPGGPQAGPWNVSTLAGVGVRGEDDGPASASTFAEPLGLASDGFRGLYVADFAGWHVRRLDIDAGTVQSVCGGVVRGATDGLGTAASFSSPAGLAYDGAGTFVLVDSGNNALRLLAPSPAPGPTSAGGGTVAAYVRTLPAGNMTQPLGLGFAGGDAFAVAGNADHTVRMFSLRAGWSLLAGSAGTAGYADGTGSAAAFNYPTGVAADEKKNVFVADALNGRLRLVSPAGAVSTLAGGGGTSGAPADGVGAAASFKQPSGVLLLSQGGGSTVLLVSDTAANNVRLVVCSAPPALSAGAIAGIVIAALAVITSCLLLEDWRRRRARHRSSNKAAVPVSRAASWRSPWARGPPVAGSVPTRIVATAGAVSTFALPSPLTAATPPQSETHIARPPPPPFAPLEIDR